MNQHTDVNDQHDDRKVENGMRQLLFDGIQQSTTSPSSYIPIKIYPFRLSASYGLSTSPPTLICFTSFEALTYMQSAFLV